MTIRWLRLVSCLTLGAYFLANSHANLVFAFPGQRNQGQHHQASSTNSSAHICQHCPEHSEDTDEGNCQPEPTCAEGCQGCSFVPPCHDCPRDGQKCPVPGGCAMCSVAKAPCLTILPTADFSMAPMVGFVCEDHFVYASPCGDGLIRPPRV